MYDLNGKKVHNLVFTVIWRIAEGLITRKYMDNYCTDKGNKCDGLFVIATWKFHLKANMLQHQLHSMDAGDEKTAVQWELDTLLVVLGQAEFLGATSILRSGDSGGHFHCSVTLQFESEVYERSVVSSLVSLSLFF
jgi:hypothetical protein